MAKQPAIVNKFGNIVGWNGVSLNVLGRDIEGVTEVSYNDSLEKENIYGAGAYPIGQGEGNYSANASITIIEEERRAILGALPVGSRIQDIAPFPITVSYEWNNVVYKDTIHNCSFMNNGVEVKQADKSIAYKFDLVVSYITWNK